MPSLKGVTSVYSAKELGECRVIYLDKSVNGLGKDGNVLNGEAGAIPHNHNIS